MKNKTARKILEIIYGKHCFIEAAGIRKICGARTLDKTLTYHHIVPVSQGGPTTIKNGAVLARYNHDWLHQQPLHIQNEINEEIEDYKIHCDFARIIVRENGTIDFEKIDEILTDTDIKLPSSIKVYSNSMLKPAEIRKLRYLRNQRQYLQEQEEEEEKEER